MDQNEALMIANDRQCRSGKPIYNKPLGGGRRGV